MEYKYIDIHSHLNLSPLWEKREEAVMRMREKGVGTITVGTDLELSARAIETAEEFPETVLGATVGLHPNDNESEVFDYEKYLALAKHPKVVAIGECGLDYFRIVNSEQQTVSSQKERQREIFQKQIELAAEVNKPLMIHARPSKGSMDAYNDALEILRQAQDSRLRANFHFFVGDTAIAEKVLELGFTMSFDGPITFTHEYDEVLRLLPLKSILAETDAPFAAPAPHRGKTCEPWMVEEVYKKIAEVKEVPLERVIEVLTDNVTRFLTN